MRLAVTALMMEQRSKFTVRGIAAEFVGELQRDVDAMESVKSSTALHQSRVSTE